MHTHLGWKYKGVHDLTLHPADLIARAQACAGAVPVAQPPGTGTTDDPYRMSSPGEWLGGAAGKLANDYTWYRIGGRLIRRDFDINYPDYMSDWVATGAHSPTYPELARSIHVDAHRFTPTEVSVAYHSPELVARQIRGCLRGHDDLRMMNWEGIPVLVATIFIAEVARNPASLLTGLMLLDLIQKRVAYEGMGPLNWENVLWKDALQTVDLYGKKLGAERVRGGLHPMARLESVKQTADPVNPKLLTLTRQFEAVVLMNWLASKEPAKATLKTGPLGGQDKHIASTRDMADIVNWKLKISHPWPRGFNPLKDRQQEALNVQAALNAEITPLFRQRLTNFDYQLK